MHQFLSLLSICAIAFVFAACGDYANTLKTTVNTPNIQGPNPTGLPDPNGVPKPGNPGGYAFSPSPVTIEEVLADPQGPDAGNQYVELFNQTSSAADIGGWVLANGTDTYTFPFGFTVQAGQRVLVHVMQAGVNSGTDQFAPSFQTLNAGQGSLALLRSGTELVDFVQWGTNGLSFEQAAELVAEWQSGDFTNVAPEGTSLDYDGTSNDSNAWHVAPITPGN
ncbi:lamin tail domain-containing protein [Planctomycetota bacterium]|nr:lamin tail domain-containing protein [Planctomycetota bacterium]